MPDRAILHLTFIIETNRSVDFRIVWGIAATELGDLEAAARRMLAARGEPSS